MQPEDDGVFQVARIAPYVKGGAQRWRVRAHFTVMNHGANKLQLVKMVLSYPGSTVKGSTRLLKDTNEKPEIDSRAVEPGKTTNFLIEDGLANPSGIGGNRSLFYPVAPKIRLKLYFIGYSNPVVYEAPQKAYVNTTPEGSYLYPGKQADLNTGEYWSHGTHLFTREQKFGYDLGVSRWNGKQWTELKSTAKKPFKNTDYLIYGKPVYTMAAGTIVNCAWSAPDNTPGVEGPKQNHFWILHGTGEIALYAHLQAGSVSKKYCPETVAENTFSLNIPIAAGVKLGNVGNSGSSDKPHLHVHVQRAVNGNKISSTGRPLLFRNSSNAGGADSVAIGSGPFSLNPLIGQMPGAPMNLIAP